MAHNTSLKVNTPTFSFQLEGDADFVRQSYEAVRREVLARLMAALPRAQGNLPSVHEVQRKSAPGNLPSGHGTEFVWVYRCNDLYNKVHVVQRSDLFQTGLGKYVHPQALFRVCVENETVGDLTQLIPTGKTLWSELTGLGRQRLRKT